MIPTSSITLLTLMLSAFSSRLVFARERWFERDRRPMFLHPRRFGQEHPTVLQKLSTACPGQVCGTLAGQAVTPLLAVQPECSQQDMADAIIDASRQFDANTQANMIALAIEYRQAEKNTPPDFTTIPPSPRNSVFCQKAPKNSELAGLVQAQDPANGPNLFFDPELQATVQKGSQANTFPFGSVAASSPVANVTSTTTYTTTTGTTEGPTTPCVIVLTVTVTATSRATTSTDAITGDTIGPVSTTGTNAPSPTPTDNIGNFGKCSVPQIEFGTGFDGRKESSFQPVDKSSYNHGSAQNIGVITQFICDTLTNSCGADQTAKNTCATARTVTSSVPTGTGAQADTFNAAFGITTKFTNTPAVDNQGKIVPGTGNTSTSVVASATTMGTILTSSTIPSPSATPGNGGIGNFGTCSIPQIEFGAGFDGRKETSYQPVDKTSYNHGSAQGIAIITQFICDRFNSGCGADDIARATCAKAQTAAASTAPGVGAQADAFNAVFGISTNFTNVTPLDDHGAVVGSANGGGKLYSTTRT